MWRILCWGSARAANRLARSRYRDTSPVLQYLHVDLATAVVDIFLLFMHNIGEPPPVISAGFSFRSYRRHLAHRVYGERFGWK
jgi:hypothetical protein